MLLLVDPGRVVNLHASDACQLECFAHPRLQFIATDVEVLVQQLVGFDHPVADGVAVRRRIILQAHHALPTDGLHQCVKCLDIVGLETSVGELPEMIEAFEFAPDGGHHRVLFIRSIEQPMQESSLDIGEIDGAGQAQEERGVGGEPMSLVLCDHDKAHLTKLPQVIVDLATRDANPVTEVFGRIIKAVDHQKDELEFFRHHGRSCSSKFISSSSVPKRL